MRQYGRFQRAGLLKNTLLFGLSLGIFASGALLLWAASLQIPDLKTFDERRVSQSTKIYDRTGEILLFDIHEAVQRTVIPFSEMSRHIKNATVAIEDAEFYEHRGVKPTAIIRAVLVNIGALGFEQGGSTITQQVVKNSILTPEKTIARKLKEWVLALKLENQTNKERILELYLNEVPYGGSLYGVEEASGTFFGKNSSELNLAEAAYLAALPQAPTYYSPYGNNGDKLEERKNLILKRMYDLGFVAEKEYAQAVNAVVDFQPPSSKGIKAPHFVFFVREQLEKKYGKGVIESGGFKITTTLDYALQQKAEEIISQYAESNEEKFNAKNAGLVAIDPKTGQILAMVGSRDYFDVENDGNFNVTVAPNRQPGSAFKPFVYATAFKKEYTPEAVVFDLETQFHAGCDPEGKPLYDFVEEDECYTPGNYDNVFRGPVTFRSALAQSINVPSIKVLYLAGIKDSIETARDMGVTSLSDENRYGLTLVLGGGEVSLLEMTSAYSVFATNGIRNPHTAILSIKDSNGSILEEYKQRPERVLDEEIALTISDVLSDNDARAPAFGQYSYLYFEDRDVAVKTGTTNDYRDAWIIGYTPNIAVGTWAGNNDNSSMEKKVAGFIVAPMWNAFMKEALLELPEEHFKKLPEENIALLKPVLRGKWLGGESYFIDKISGKLATQYTPEETKEERFITNIHSILYWIDKKDPRGDYPPHPENDPQFSLWETSVRKWVKNLNIQEETREDIITELDTVHKPEFIPQLNIKGFNSEHIYSPYERITLNVEGRGKFPISRIDLFINNVYIGASKARPFVFSFTPSEIADVKKENTIKIVGYDAVMNKGEVRSVLKLNSPN